MDQTPGSDIGSGMVDELQQTNPLMALLRYLVQMGGQSPAPQAPTGPQWAQGGAPGQMPPQKDLRSQMTEEQSNAYQKHRMGERGMAGLEINPYMPQDAFNRAYANKKFPWGK